MDKPAVEPFLAKLFKEADYLKSEALFSLAPEKGVRVELVKKGVTLKSYQLGSAWLEPLSAALKIRPVKSGEYTFKLEELSAASWRLSEINPGVTADEPAESRSPAKKSSGTSGRHVLVVEDDRDQSEIVEIMLKGIGYEVTLAADGKEALARLASIAPDLIISDLMMPNMDGTEFVKQLKKNPATAGIPILVLTVLSDPEKEFSLLNMGVDDYCQKTVPRKILQKRIENLISRRRD